MSNDDTFGHNYTQPVHAHVEPVPAPEPDYGFIRSGSGLTVHFTSGSSFTWTPDHPRYYEAIDLLKRRAPASELEAIMDFKKALAPAIPVATQTHGDLVLNDDGVSYKGKLLNLSLTDRIIQMVREGWDATPMLRFLERLLQNPRREAVQSLYDFMEHNKLPITADGYFLAYKIVRSDYMDIFSGQFDNSVGKVCEMEPWEVDANRDQTCSAGLHVCSRDYLPHYGSGGSRVMIVRVDPSAVVAVPRDYNNAKMRVWKYEVIGEMDSKESASILEQYGVFGRSAMEGTATNFSWGSNAVEDEVEDEVEVEDDYSTWKKSLRAAYPKVSEVEDEVEVEDDYSTWKKSLRAAYPKVSEDTLRVLADEISGYDTTLVRASDHTFDYANSYFMNVNGTTTFVEINENTAEDLAYGDSKDINIYVVFPDDVGGDAPVEDVRIKLHRD